MNDKYQYRLDQLYKEHDIGSLLINKLDFWYGRTGRQHNGNIVSLRAFEYDWLKIEFPSDQLELIL